MNVIRMTDKGPSIFCPGCKYTHVFNAPATPTSGGASWQWNGSMELPTFTPSMHCQVGKTCKPGTDGRNRDDWVMETTCHSFVTNGRVQFLSDCQHELVGQTVDLPEHPA